MSSVDWENDPESWDTATIGGERLPGVVVPDAETARDLDEQKAKGKKGAKIKNNGDPARKPKLDWIFTAGDWAEVQRIKEAVLDPRKSSKLDPLEIIHPVLNFHGITTVLVKAIKGPKIDKGLATISLELIEYIKPKAAAGVGTGTKGTGGGLDDAALAYLQNQLAQLDATIYQLEAMKGQLINADPAQASDLAQKIAELKSKKLAILDQMGKPSKKGAQQT